jgi:CDP-glucose 4,6-dehydratase
MKQQLEQFRNKKVFVTGHTGFKGSWMIAMLHQLGANIKGFALTPTHSAELFETIDGNTICESIIGNIKDQALLEKEILSFQPDFIFHLAAQPLVRASYSAPSETFAVNVLGTSFLLEAALKLTNPCTIIVITTDKVYENKETSIYYTEKDTLGGYDPYSTSKACAELVSTSFIRSFLSKDTKHTITTARAGNVIGGGDFSEDRIIPDFIRSIQKEESLIIRNPHAVRPWQHVLEPILGYLMLALKKAANQTIGNAYNFGPQEKDHLKVVDLIKHAIDYTQKGNFKIIPNDDLHEANQLRLSIDAAKNDLNWIPMYSAKKAIELTMDWYFSADKKVTITEQIKHFLDAVEEN